MAIAEGASGSSLGRPPPFTLGGSSCAAHGPRVQVHRVHQIAHMVGHPLRSTSDTPKDNFLFDVVVGISFYGRGALDPGVFRERQRGLEVTRAALASDSRSPRYQGIARIQGMVVPSVSSDLRAPLPRLPGIGLKSPDDFRAHRVYARTSDSPRLAHHRQRVGPIRRRTRAGGSGAHIAYIRSSHRSGWYSYHADRMAPTSLLRRGSSHDIGIRPRSRNAHATIAG